jgi:hypothetical protein
MTFPLPMAALAFVLGTTTSVFAREEGRQAEHQQQGRPAQQQVRPAQQQARPQQRQARPEAQHQATNANNREQQHAQPQPRFQQPQGRSVNREQRSQHAVGARGGHEHGRISNDHYAARFGREHSFHVHRGDYDHRRFRYGGYDFGFVEPWPIGWGYSDDVYVEYDDSGYYMYNRVHPGMRISIDIL